MLNALRRVISLTRTLLVSILVGCVLMVSSVQSAEQLHPIRQDLYTLQVSDKLQKEIKALVIKEAVEYIAKNEGFEEYVYDDTMGIPTLGFGFNLKTTPLPEDLAREWLRRLVNEAYIKVEKQYAYFKKLTPARQVALVDLYYNLGPNGLAQFKRFHEAMIAGEFTRAGDELLNSVYAKQVKGRATRNKELIVNG